MWARPGYREINPGAAGILNNEQLPSVLSRAETKTWFRDTQIELLSLFKPSLSGRAVSCCSQSREGWKFSNAKPFKCPDSWHGVLGLHLLPGPHGTKTVPEVRPQAWKACPRPSTKRKATGFYHERAVRTHQAYQSAHTQQQATSGTQYPKSRSWPICGWWDKQHAKEWNRIETIKVSIYLGKQIFHLGVYLYVYILGYF